MMKLWNPIEAYRKASLRSRDERAHYEANAKICIRDYTDSKGATYTALLIDGIPVHRITADNIAESENQMVAIRKEYYNKRMAEIGY